MIVGSYGGKKKPCLNVKIWMVGWFCYHFHCLIISTLASEHALTRVLRGPLFFG